MQTDIKINLNQSADLRKSAKWLREKVTSLFECSVRGVKNKLNLILPDDKLKSSIAQRAMTVAV